MHPFKPHRLWGTIPPGAPPRAIDRVLTNALGRIRRGLFVGSVPDKKKRLYYIAMRDGWVCRYCGATVGPAEATVDHIYPRARGGKNSVRNLALCCRRCNVEKRDRTPTEWRAAIAERP